MYQYGTGAACLKHEPGAISGPVWLGLLVPVLACKHWIRYRLNYPGATGTCTTPPHCVIETTEPETPLWGSPTLLYPWETEVLKARCSGTAPAFHQLASIVH